MIADDLEQVQITPDLVLRPYRVAYADVVWSAVEASRERLRDWVPDVARLTTASEVAAGLAGLERARLEGRKAVYGLFRASDETFVAECGLYAMDPVRGVGTVGLWVCSGHERRGYGTLILRAMADLARSRFGLAIVEARVHPANVASQSLMARAGFEPVGWVPAWPDSEGDTHQVRVYRYCRG